MGKTRIVTARSMSAMMPMAVFASARVTTQSAESATGATLKWSSVLVATWTAGLLLAAVSLWRRWRRTAGVIQRSAAAPPATQAMAADLAAGLGLRYVPPVRVSHDVDTPLVAGGLRPVVLLPFDALAALSDRQQRMALCHELAHIKRADLWLGCVPAIAERVFFFHPLAHLAAREYALCREAACDATVIDTLDAAPKEYGRLLLALGVSRRATALAVAGAPSSFSTLKRRIVMLRDPSTRSRGSRLIAAMAVAIAVVAIAPLRLAARPDEPVPTVQDVLPQWAVVYLSRMWFGPGRAWIGDLSEDLQSLGERTGLKERDVNYVLLLDDHNGHMSGSLQDIERARRYRRGGERLLWFRQSGREYVVRDPGLLDQILAIWKPVGDIGDRQGELGARQGELGTRQGELGARQGQIGAEQGNLGARQGALGARQAVMAAREGTLWTDAERRAFDEERRQIEREMRELDREMRALDPKMRELEKPMQDLGKQMEAFGKEMEALGRQMEEAVRKAEGEMRELLERAIARSRPASQKR